MELGKKIRLLRFRAGLTQEQLAQKLGIGPQSVSKWENEVAMPDISALPLLAEIFGVTIDDLFDLTVEQRLNRIENRLDTEEDLPQDVFMEYEGFLKSLLSDDAHKQRANSLIAFLYWHRMAAMARKVRVYAKDAIRMAPNKKDCQWTLNMAENHYCWDWNMSNHLKAIEFYREVVKDNPDCRLPYMYLIDNLIADHRADEAEKYLERMSRLEGANPIMVRVYRAHIALARFDESKADAIIEQLGREYPDDEVYLFEAAQYYAKKGEYEKAIAFYERDFSLDEKRPRFTDALDAIKDIYEIMGRYKDAAATCDRIIELLQNEWHMTEETALKAAQKEKARLLAKA